MGADSRMENSSDGGGLRAIHSRRDVSYLCGGRPADGDHLRHFFWPVSGAGPVPRSVRGGGDSPDLVLHCTDWLACICHSSQRYADGGHWWLGPETTQRVNQFPFRGGADHFTLAAPTALPRDRKSTRLNSSHMSISYAVFCLKKKTTRARANVHRPIRPHQTTT